MRDNEFKIDFTALYRDKADSERPSDHGNVTNRPKWRDNIDETFVQNISIDDVRRLEGKMFNFLNDVHSITQTQIDDVTNEFCNILKTSADKCKMYENNQAHRPQNRKAHPSARQKYAWQNQTSLRARTTYRNAARYYKLRGGIALKAVRSRTFAVYQKTLNKNFNSYVRRTRKKIRSLRSTDPNRYWKIINGSNKDKSDELNCISHEIFSQHFEKLEKWTKVSFLSLQLCKTLYIL